MQTLVKMVHNNPNKQILSPAKIAGCDANRVRGRRAKFGSYEISMKQLVLILIFATALNQANASPPIAMQELTPENAKALGFNVTIEVSNEGVTVDIAGPKSIEDDCFPRKIGNSVLNKEGKEIATYIAMLPTTHQEIPVAFGHYRSNENTMSVFIDYICPPEKIYRSKRFIVSSVAKYLITSQSSSPASQAGRR